MGRIKLCWVRRHYIHQKKLGQQGKLDEQGKVGGVGEALGTGRAGEGGGAGVRGCSGAGGEMLVTRCRVLIFQKDGRSGRLLCFPRG